MYHSTFIQTNVSQLQSFRDRHVTYCTNMGFSRIARWYLFICVALLIFQMEFSIPHVWTLFPYVIARWCLCLCFRISYVWSFYNTCMLICGRRCLMLLLDSACFLYFILHFLGVQFLGHVYHNVRMMWPHVVVQCFLIYTHKHKHE